MTENAIAPTTDDAKREVALLKAIGFDRLAPEQRDLALNIAAKYELDPFLRHLVIIDGKPFITRDALLYIAHRSGVFDGIGCTTPEIVGDEWRCTATVWRKDWSHAVEYGGRYPVKGANTKFGPEMAIKVAESMALRRAFNVAAPVAEERWDLEVPVDPPAPKVTLAERAAEKAAAVKAVEHVEAIVLEPMTEEVSASTDVPPWTRERLHDAAVNAKVPGSLVTSTFNDVAGSRTRAELTEADWREIALRLGLGA